MSKDKEVLLNNARVEKKYIVNIIDYQVLASLLKSTMEIDPHSNDNNEYIVRSLYFDTPDNSDVSQKVQGVFRRTKTRLRIYDPNQQNVKIENKRKYGSHTKKQSVTISKNDALSLIDLDYSCLLNYKNEELNEIFGIMSDQYRTPKVIVEYDREAYIHKDLNVRINFDKRIRVAHSHELFSENLDFIPIYTDNFCVLEVKYNNMLPKFVQEILSSFDFVETAYSKYVKSRF